MDSGVLSISGMLKDIHLAGLEAFLSDALASSWKFGEAT